MKTTIIIPAYNEEKTVGEIIERVKKLPISKEIIVVDDGSRDSTFDKIREISGIKAFRHKKNMGKGAAVRTGIKNSTGDIILVQDADLELDPKQIPKLIAPIVSNKAKVVYGSRNINNPDTERSSLFYLGGHLVTLLTNVLYGISLTDEPCGYKVFRSDVIKSIRINSNRFEWEPEVTAKIAKKGIRIFEVPVRSRSRSIKQGKKLRRIDGIKAVLTLVKYKFRD